MTVFISYYQPVLLRKKRISLFPVCSKIIFTDTFTCIIITKSIRLGITVIKCKSAIELGIDTDIVPSIYTAVGTQCFIFLQFYIDDTGISALKSPPDCTPPTRPTTAVRIEPRNRSRPLACAGHTV